MTEENKTTSETPIRVSWPKSLSVRYEQGGPYTLLLPDGTVTVMAIVNLPMRPSRNWVVLNRHSEWICTAAGPHEALEKYLHMYYLKCTYDLLQLEQAADAHRELHDIWDTENRPRSMSEPLWPHNISHVWNRVGWCACIGGATGFQIIRDGQNWIAYNDDASTPPEPDADLALSIFMDNYMKKCKAGVRSCKTILAELKEKNFG